MSESLPILSQKGSKDDISVACIYNTDNLKYILPKLIEYQLDVNTDKLTRTEDKIMDLDNKLSGWRDKENITKKENISIEYAKKDIIKYKEQAKLLYNRIEALKLELTAALNSLE